MSVPFLIIDGYNLLHAAGLARMQYGPGDLERARHRLLVQLAEKLRADERRRCTVVFDAQQAPVDLPRESLHHDIAVQFAPPGQDADTVIERMIATHPASRRTIIVSSDHRLHQAAKRRSSKPIDSEQFFEQLQRRESQSPLRADIEPAANPPPRPQKPLESAWLREFADVDVQGLEEEVGREPLPDGTRALPESTHWDELQQQLDDPAWLERWLRDEK